jgi:hypothetical protein
MNLGKHRKKKISHQKLASVMSIQKPSDKHVKKRISKVYHEGSAGNIFDSQLVLDLFLQVFENVPGDPIAEVAREACSMIQRFNLQNEVAGVFGPAEDGKQGELTLSALLSVAIARVFPKDIKVCHQLHSRPGTAPMDITALKDFGTSLFPSFLIEVGLDASDKVGQAFSYAQNCFSHYFPKNVYCFLPVVVIKSNWELQLRCIYHTVDPKKFTDLLIYRADPFNEDDLARVLSALLWWTTQLEVPTEKTTTVDSKKFANANVKIQGDTVFKLYNYLYRGRVSPKRDPTGLVEHQWIPGAKVQLNLCLNVVILVNLYFLNSACG